MFDAMVGESALDAVALDLARRGVLYGSEAVQGNPGPSLDVCVVVEATAASEATATASALVIEALRTAGVETGSYEFESRVLPLSEVEQRIQSARAEAQTITGNSNWLTVRVERNENDDTPPPGASSD
ncbi:MAG TPA: hypothetical protein VFJ50_03275 [Gemmatimonadales bacterium]|nr:hypothetical protein [Gemmatimonadales bacterium]